ncbi:MAG: DUF1501 domain-containing protein, partial [Pirellulaceae bacterium]
FRRASTTRRDMLKTCGMGFGVAALSALLQNKSSAGLDSSGKDRHSAFDPLKPRQPHFQPRAKSVIFLYMDGGVSHVDSFDPKPMLNKHNGQDPRKLMEVQPTQFNNIGKVLASPWKFKNYGKCGLPVSDLFPHVAAHADELCVIRSMTSKFSEHTNANYFLHTGNGTQGRPSMGSWVTYGLGSECQDLPGYVVLNGGLIPPGGQDNFNSGYLPASYQGSVFNSSSHPVANIRRTEATDLIQKNKLDVLNRLDRDRLQQRGAESQIESAISNYELAYRMQMAVPGLIDLSDETKATLDMYGIHDKFKNTQTFGRNCLVARRLIEKGVRFIELTCPGGNGDRWDQHANLKDGHTKNALSVDKPIAGLLADLKQRGLLDSTLVIWSGEFGRTPFAQGSNGRDHNPFGFSLWMAGGGLKGGITYGATDDYGYKAIDKKVEIHDLHATMLHLLGMDHTKMTYRFSSRDMRLTDVHGNVIRGILA